MNTYIHAHTCNNVCMYVTVCMYVCMPVTYVCMYASISRSSCSYLSLFNCSYIFGGIQRKALPALSWHKVLLLSMPPVRTLLIVGWCPWTEDPKPSPKTPWTVRPAAVFVFSAVMEGLPSLRMSVFQVQRIQDFGFKWFGVEEIGV